MSLSLPQIIGIAILFGAGVVAAVLVQQRRMAFRVTCEVFRGQPLDDVLRTVPSGSLEFIHLDDSYHPYSVVIVSVWAGQIQGTLQSEFRRTQGEPLIRNWPAVTTKSRVIRGLFQVPGDVISVVTRVVDATPSDS